MLPFLPPVPPPPPILPPTSSSGLAAPEPGRMEYPRSPGAPYHAPPPPMSSLRPPTPSSAVHAVAAPTPSADAMKRKRQGNHLIQGGPADAAPPSFGPASVPPVKAAGGRKKTGSTSPTGACAKSPRKNAITARGRAPPPPTAGHNLPIHGDSTGHAYHVFDETTGRYFFPFLLDLLR